MIKRSLVLFEIAMLALAPLSWAQFDIKPQVDLRLQSAVLQLVGLKASTPIDKFVDVEKWVAIVAGTAFAVQVPAGEVWITAAHVTEPMQSLGGDYYLLNAEQSAMKPASYKELFAAMDKGVVKIPVSEIHEDVQLKYDLGIRGDFSYFLSPVPLAKNHSFELRDARTRPLQYNESLRVAGRHFGQGEFANLDCRYIGMHGQFFKAGGQQLLLDCKNLPVNQKGDVLLGSVSGGAVLDVNQRVVAVFNGLVTLREGRQKIVLLRATPLYLGVTGLPQLYPVLEVGAELSFACLDIERDGFISLFRQDVSQMHKPCTISSQGFQ